MEDSDVFALHRYFLQADEMRKRFLHTLKDDDVEGSKEEKAIYQFMYLGLWYGSLCVVVEGWRTLKLANDPTVDQLLKSDYVRLLQRYRNGVFHYQKKYYDDRFTAFMKHPDTPAWVHDLHSAFSRYFLEWFAEKRSQRRPGTMGNA